jgi:hypothetical protein
MPSLRCPHCALVNPGSAIACDCGYSFKDGHVGQSYLAPKQQVERMRGATTDPGMRILMGIIRVVIIAGTATAVKMCMWHH